MRVAALTLVAWTLYGGQLCSTTGLDLKKGFGLLDPRKGFGSQLSPLGMCWIETQQALFRGLSQCLSTFMRFAVTTMNQIRKVILRKA